MPIESQFATDPIPDPPVDSVAAQFLVTARRTLYSAAAKVEHCLGQLTDEDLQWREFAEHNSVHNLVLHVCGNLGQWILSGVGGATDVRQREREFSDRGLQNSEQLAARLARCVAEVDVVLQDCTPERLREVVEIQGFRLSVLAAIWDSLNHFVGHMQQIVYITRLRRGADYQFHWSPQDH